MCSDIVVTVGNVLSASCVLSMSTDVVDSAIIRAAEVNCALTRCPNV